MPPGAEPQAQADLDARLLRPVRSHFMSEVTPVDNRKDLLLLTLAAESGAPVVGVTRLQKYMYLLQEQGGWKSRLKRPYEFRAYDYGPFDDQIYADLDFLENLDLIEKEAFGDEPSAENGEERAASESWATRDPEFAPEAANGTIWAYRLTDKGREFVENRLKVDEADQESVERLKQRWNSVPLSQFLKWLYSEYPEMAANTKLTHLRAQ